MNGTDQDTGGPALSASPDYEAPPGRLPAAGGEPGVAWTAEPLRRDRPMAPVFGWGLGLGLVLGGGLGWALGSGVGPRLLGGDPEPTPVPPFAVPVPVPVPLPPVATRPAPAPPRSPARPAAALPPVRGAMVEPEPKPEPEPEPEATCGSKHACKDMTSCAEARFFLTRCGLSRLDRNGDGVPCESLCAKK